MKTRRLRPRETKRGKRKEEGEEVRWQARETSAEKQKARYMTWGMGKRRERERRRRGEREEEGEREKKGRERRRRGEIEGKR